MTVPAQPAARPARWTRHALACGVAGLVAAAVVIVTMLGAAAPASAHDALAKTSPEADTTVTEALEDVQLTFVAEPLETGTEVLVMDQDGTDWSSGEATHDGATITQPLTSELPSGTYEVQWRVVSGDGHPISGSYAFDVEVAPVADEESPSPSASPSGTTSEVSAPTDASGSASATPAADRSSDTSGDSSLFAVAIGAIVLVVVVVVVVAFVRRRYSAE
ncbi:hypothetical protein APR04_005690 [Promicromonospora umidemergens]|uniref:Copper resistance protein CopC n=3 Tax=Promicromonospora TaxID=43676 RepID=A0ABW4VAW6_9MICO|nr:copper resistance CopC family protein [Promicromonospora umidemergens]MCP2286750.1 hypothetical protein [Promicromonospora umidemergens]